MKRYKRLLSLLILSLLLITFVGCGRTSQANTTSKDNNVTVYITKSGKKYHKDGCIYLAKSKISISLQDAKAKGYSPCSKCNPPQ